MLKLSVGLGVLLFFFVFAMTFVPGVAAKIPEPQFVRETATTFAVLSFLAALLAWRPRDMDVAEPAQETAS